MKILFFHRWVGVHKGGTETHIRELADRFQKLGHDITILTREGKELSDFNLKVRIIRISKNWQESEHSYEDFRVYLHTLLFMIKSFFKLFCLLIEGDCFDVISVHFFTESWVAKFYSFFKKTPIIFVLEGYTPLEAQAAKFADKRISISKFEADMYFKKHGVDSKTIPVGIDTNRFNVKKEEVGYLRGKFANSNEKLAITVCRLEPRKDIPALIKAVSYGKEKLKNIKFLIVGDGISRELIENEIQKKNLSSKVILAGRISDEDLPKYYACADFFVLPTKQEWFGIVFLEAMASGLPIITTDIDACPEVVGECGAYFKPGDFKTLAEKIEKLSGNESLIGDLSQKAKEKARAFDWDKLISGYEKEYLSLN